MREGSIVVVLPCPIGEGIEKLIKWLPVMDEKTPYMIRKVPWRRAAYLEEGVIGHYKGNEIAISFEYLREILPPEDIQEKVNQYNYQEARNIMLLTK